MSNKAKKLWKRVATITGQTLTLGLALFGLASASSARDTRDSVGERIDRVRKAVHERTQPADGSSGRDLVTEYRLSQWGNWGNWYNWYNWNDWNDWNDWNNWYNWAKWYNA